MPLFRVKVPSMAKLESFVRLEFSRQTEEAMVASGRAFYEHMAKRRSVRDFSDKSIPASLLENAILAAGTAPSGANMQPWHFVVVQDAAVKRKIRVAAEIEERELYANRASDEWLQALAPLGTGADKPFLETAPALIAIFLKKVSIDDDGQKHKNYYTSESVGIATGMLITALHQAGLATLTHTPSPMKFLTEILERPSHERPFLLLVTGYPADGTKVPDIGRFSLDQIASFI